MAQAQIGGFEPDSIVAKNRAVAGSVAVTTSVYATPANYGSIAAIRTRLTAINGAYFTSAKMDTMSANDLIFALRSLDDPLTMNS